MPETTLKPPEVIQAQIATFAAERVEYFEDRKHIFNNLGSLALGAVNDITRITTSAEFHNDANGDRTILPKGAERTATTGEDYVSFLRSVGGSQYEGIQGRAEMLTAYAEFAPIVDRLRGELADPTTRKEHPAYLSNGSNSTVFTISHGEKKYAVRVPDGDAIKPGEVDSHMAGAVLGKGLPHLEQIVAASYEDGVTVAEVLPGKEAGDLTVEDVEQVTDGQINDLVDTLVAANARGIEIDVKPSNFLYDPEAGYSIVDYHSSKKAGKNTQDQEVGVILGWASEVIINVGFYEKEHNPDKTTDDYAHDLELHKANLGVLERYRAIVESKLKGEDQQKALAEVDLKAKGQHKTIENHLNPEWVAASLVQNAEFNQKIAERLSRQGSPLDDWITL